MFLKRLFTSKIVLYLVVFLALTNVVGYLLHKDIRSLTFFIIIGYLSSRFSKNMIINLLVAILSTNILIANGKVQEGMEGGEDEGDDEEEVALETFKEGNKKKKKKEQQGGGDDEAFGVHRIDSAATMSQAYNNLQSVLGKGGMRKLGKDTKILVGQQKELMKSVEQMQPMMKQLGGMVKGFGGPEGINQMMSNLKNLGGLKPPQGAPVQQ